jgi:hypothetical protein
MVSRKFHFFIPVPLANMPDLSEYMTVREAAKDQITESSVRSVIKLQKFAALSGGKMYIVSQKSADLWRD